MEKKKKTYRSDAPKPRAKKFSSLEEKQESREARLKLYARELVRAIKKYGWTKFKRVDYTLLSFCERTAYEYNLQNLHVVKNALKANMVVKTNDCIDRWRKSDDKTLQILAFKLEADKEDVDLITNKNYVFEVNEKSNLPEFFKSFKKEENVGEEGQS